MFLSWDEKASDSITLDRKKAQLHLQFPAQKSTSAFPKTTGFLNGSDFQDTNCKSLNF